MFSASSKAGPRCLLNTRPWKRRGRLLWGKTIFTFTACGRREKIGGKGYGKALLESCLEDARAQGKSGVCLLGAAKQKAWLTDQAFFRRFGFETVETTPNGYELLALSFDGSKPHFAPQLFQMESDSPELTVYYDDQCPFIHQTLEKLRRYCAENGEPLNLRHVDSLDMAKKLPCVFNNWAAFYGGKFVTVNLTDGASILRAAQQAKNR